MTRIDWWALRLAALIILVGLAAAASAADTVSCDGKRGWQRRVTQDAVHRWFASQSRPEDLIELVQAEQGLAACSAGGSMPLRLHSATLPRGLELDQLGPILLANELEWSGLVPRPEAGLAGELFRIHVGAAEPVAGASE